MTQNIFLCCLASLGTLTPLQTIAQSGEFYPFYRDSNTIQFIRHDGGEKYLPQVTWRVNLIETPLAPEYTDTAYVIQCSKAPKIAKAPKSASTDAGLLFEDIDEINRTFLKYLDENSPQQAFVERARPNSMRALAIVACAGREEAKAQAASVFQTAGIENLIQLKCTIDRVSGNSNPMSFTVNFSDEFGYLQFRGEWLATKEISPVEIRFPTTSKDKSTYISISRSTGEARFIAPSVGVFARGACSIASATPMKF